MAARPARVPGQRSCPEFLYWIKAARLRRAARAGGHGPPPLHVSATAPAAPTRSARNIAEANSQTRKQLDHSEHQGQADAHEARPRHPTAHRSKPHGPQSRSPSPVAMPRRQRPGRIEAQSVTHGRSVAEAGTGLLETHVTGARSEVAPSWLTFGGSGQNWAEVGRTATLVLSNSATGSRGWSRTHVRARRPPRYHRHRGPDQGFRDRTTPNAVQAEGWSGLLLLASAARATPDEPGLRDQLRALPTS